MKRLGEYTLSSVWCHMVPHPHGLDPEIPEFFTLKSTLFGLNVMVHERRFGNVEKYVGYAFCKHFSSLSAQIEYLGVWKVLTKGLTHMFSTVENLRLGAIKVIKCPQKVLPTYCFWKCPNLRSEAIKSQDEMACWCSHVDVSVELTRSCGHYALAWGVCMHASLCESVCKPASVNHIPPKTEVRPGLHANTECAMLCL